MKALVKFALGSEHVELRELPEPSPREGELKVKVLAASICGSDIHAIYDERPIAMPLTLGHEYVGQVVETCGDTGDFKVGDWVMTIPACYNCGTCDLCKSGAVTLCPEHKSIGVMAPGAMADYVIVPAAYSYHVPNTADTIREKISYALTEPLTCVVRGVYENVHVNPGDVVVVSGPGVMGQMATQLFKSRGAYVILSGLPVDKEKLEQGKRLGADETVCSFEELKAAVYRKNPLGAHITCECTGVIPSLNNCMEVIRPHGTHLQIGLFGGAVPFRLDYLFEREVTYIATNSTATTTWPITLKLLEEGKVTMEPFVSLVLPLSRWKEGFDAAIQKSVYKAVLIPDDQYAELFGET